MSYYRMFTISLLAGTIGVLLGMGHTDILPAYGLILAWEMVGAWRECLTAEARGR